MRVHVVTDSSAQFAHPQVAAQYPVTVVPNTLMIGGTPYREGVDLTAERALELIAHHDKPPQLIPPTVDDFVAVYTRLAYHFDVIISVHASRHLMESYANGQEAAKQLEGHVQVHVVDSRTLDAAQGMIVRAAVRLGESMEDAEQLIRRVRGAAESAYALYVVEKTDYMVHNGLISPSHAVLNAMSGTMPLVAIEEGELILTEKVRSRSQAVDRMIEFVIEFEQIEDGLILQPRTFMNEYTRNLQDRLTQEFPERHFPHTIYGATLATFIGVEATGLAVLESEDDDNPLRD